MRIAVFVIASLLAAPLWAQDLKPTQTLPLWPGGAPGAKGSEPADIPVMDVYLPRRRITDCGVVVFPGGGYKNLALNHEGVQVAEWLNAHGIAAFVVHYRLLPRYAQPTPLIDAQRAIRLVRSDAARYRVSPSKIGVMGFSAGGHLASMTGVYFDTGKPDAADPIDRAGSRPDFMVLVYPGINFQSVEAPAMLGDDVTPQRRDFINTDKHVRPDTPPAFLFHTDEDKADHSVAFYLALSQAGVPAEMHIYQRGRHGMGLAPGHPFLGNWPDLLALWLRRQGVLEITGKK